MIILIYTELLYLIEKLTKIKMPTTFFVAKKGKKVNFEFL